MWPFTKESKKKTIYAHVSTNADGLVSIDVSGQTCPGYLLAINNAMDSLGAGTDAILITTYAPCGDDVKAWCKEKGYTYKGMVHENGMWKISVKK